MRYILLLRGINVGGKNKVSMAEFKEKLFEAGFENIASYLNSGNLFFSTDKPYDSCQKLIDDVLKTYDFKISYVLLDRESYQKLRDDLPSWWFDNLARKDVLFLIDPTELPKVKESIENMTLYNELVYFSDGVIFWGKVDEKEFLKTEYHKKLIKQDYYKRLTIRNGKTFDKIALFVE